MLDIMTNPTIQKLAGLLESAFRARRFILIIGDCRIDYEGRASSTLEWGERVTIIKEDGSVLVHRSTGCEPINWQPPRCLITLSQPDDTIVITASRTHPREVISIEFREVSFTALGSLNDRAEFALHVTEAQMKQAIITAPSLVEDGLRPLEEEKYVGDAGFTDIYGTDKNGSLVILEIKRNAATKDAVTQLHGYLMKIQKRVNRPLRGIIVAPELRRSAQPLLQSLKIEFVKLDPEKCFSVLRSQKDMKLNQFLP